MTTNRTTTFVLAALLGLAAPTAAGAPTDMTTYQGRLLDGGEPVAGPVDLAFRLYDAENAGTQIGPELTAPGFADFGADGTFTMDLDFGPGAFDGAPRWLEIDVDTTTLGPRQPITAAPYALFALNGGESPWQLDGNATYYDDGPVGVGTSAISGETSLHVSTSQHDNFGVLVDAFGTSGTEIGLHTGVAGYSSLAKNAYFDQGRWHRFDEDMGAFFQEVTPAGDVNFGVANAGAGPIDWAYPLNLVLSGDDPFVGVNRTGRVSFAEFFGVRAPVDAGYGGMYVSTDGNDARPFYGYSAGGDIDAYHHLDGATGYWHLNVGGSNQMTVTNGTVGVGVTVPDRTAQLHVVQDVGTAVRAATDGPSGGIGVWATGYTGVFASSAESGGYGIYGRGDGGAWAGYFDGSVRIVGNIFKGGGSFKIDHPLDPENQYLSHSFVESPDMMNIYNGNVVTDDGGYAEIVLPEWFEALNRDFRYQLTVVDEADSADFVLAKIVRGVEGNTFVLRTNAPYAHVSWQVTGIRQDPFANANRIPVEEPKPESERGSYLHPDAYGATSRR